MPSINWNSFENYNHDSRGIEFKFEDLCRQLFINEHKLLKRYLHANPNNPGLETEPILNCDNKRIGFQAKYFQWNVDYSKIYHSAEMVVKHYQGNVDCIYIFCNKPLTESSCESTFKLLAKAGITVELVTDNAILDLVRKYPYLAYYYFDNHSISLEWVKNNIGITLAGLGKRFNKAFNIPTHASEMLSLFVRDDAAASYINSRKTALLKELDENRYKYYKYSDFVCELHDIVSEIADVTTDTLLECVSWYTDVMLKLGAPYHCLREQLSIKEQKATELSHKAFDNHNELTEKERDAAKNKYWNECADINVLHNLIDLPETLKISEEEQGLLNNRVLFVNGDAGCGKTQLLANETQFLLDTDRICIFIAAGTLFADNSITSQILDKLNLNYSFDELLDVLNAAGERLNRIVPIFFDALNETWNGKLWETDLPFIVAQVQKRDYLRLVVSYRSEYEKSLISCNLIDDISIGKISVISHRGFRDNSIEAIKVFFNENGIPFTPSAYFEEKLSNPLFLTLYCKTYNGNEIDFQNLYDNVIAQANQNIFNTHGKTLKLKGYDINDDIVSPFIYEYAEWCVINKRKFIKHSELSSLAYWNMYNLTMPVFIKLLSEENILYDTVYDGEKCYYFAFDQMNDYYQAKAIVQKYTTKDSLFHYFKTELLQIKNGVLSGYSNIGIFVTACSFFEEQYGTECISLIDAIDDEEDRNYIFNSYVRSFQWRKASSINPDLLISSIQKYGCNPDDFWSTLISNSTKINHPLNGDFLHKTLLNYPVNKRDYLWTIYINEFTYDDSNRVVQLINDLNCGKIIDMTSDKQYELLLTLLTWILTSSNRLLRDCASKAMIEILKTHFALCAVLLRKFEDINDPYVLQRLYGVVFGACCKRVSSESIKNLAEYIYESVFNRNQVYPDILLRDYARLIIERFLYEEPEYKGKIERSKIKPPYNSEPISEIQAYDYDYDDLGTGESSIIWSMNFEGMGMYGDFGRYVYQSALRDFDVDEKKTHAYSLNYIFNNLGYKNEWFGQYDRGCESFGRNDVIKIERIGKKYQWITMYNVLARVSDHNKKIDSYAYPETDRISFDGAWDPYVRDFDPTLNEYFLTCNDAPSFKQLEDFIHTEKESIADIDMSNEIFQKSWLSSVDSPFVSNLKDTCSLVDDTGMEWIALTKYIDTGRKSIEKDKAFVWSWMYAYFVPESQADKIKKYFQCGNPIINSSIASHNETYTVFNREYPWSPACAELNKNSWINLEITFMEDKTERVDMSGNTANTNNQALTQKCIDERTAFENAEKMLHSTVTLLWEEEYDASKHNAISYNVPCSKLINDLKLKQLESDGFFYDSNNCLAAFDTELIQHIGGAVIRKDLLVEFLKKNNLKLMWFVDLQKEIHANGLYISKYSEFEGLYVFCEDGNIVGDIRNIGIKE